MKKLLLIDGDILAYQAAASAETTVQWTEHLWSLHVNPQEAIGKAVKNLEEICEKLGAEEVLICLSDVTNFRYEIFPEYKGNRKDMRRPMCLKEVRQYLRENYEVMERPNLEADDVMGILSTWDKFRPDYRKIIVSKDKDMKTINGWLFNPDTDEEEHYVEAADADAFFYAQALAGDTTDGYGGCPSVGLSTAQQLLSDRYKYQSYEHTFKSGARVGLTETRWAKVESESPWATVLSCYEKQGLSLEYALTQARLARILRCTDYDFKKKEVKLWLPS